MIEYVERRASATLDYVRKSYDDLYERAYKLATLLLGGGGGMTAYAMSQLSPDTSPLTWAPIGALALTWFGIAGALLWRGALSKLVSPGNGPENLLGYFQARRKDGWGEMDSLAVTRRAELDADQVRLRSYIQGCEARADAIDCAYKSLAIFSPLTPLTVVLICLWLF